MISITPPSVDEARTIYTASLSQPVVAENSLEATASQRTIVDGSCTSESRAAVSIKKLHSLTITDSWKESNSTRPDDDTPGNSKQNRSATQPDSPRKSPRFSNFRRRNKETENEESTIKRGKSFQATNHQESTSTVTDKEPSTGDGASSVPQASGEEGVLDLELKSQEPKFYTSDMMVLIDERNELKEKVLQLDDTLREMER